MRFININYDPSGPTRDWNLLEMGAGDALGNLWIRIKDLILSFVIMFSGWSFVSICGGVEVGEDGGVTDLGSEEVVVVGIDGDVGLRDRSGDAGGWSVFVEDGSGSGESGGGGWSGFVVDGSSSLGLLHDGSIVAERAGCLRLVGVVAG